MYEDIEEPGETEPFPDREQEALAAWKSQLRAQFGTWLESVDEIPEVPEPDGAPDLYSLYKELSALRAENRKGNRKSAEVFSQFGDSLGQFESEVKRLREQLARMAPHGEEPALPRSHCLALVEVLDRMHRLHAALGQPPKPGRFAFLQPDRPWREAWENHRQAFAILVTHMDKLIEKTGVHPLRTVGEVFDPTTMVAVATVPAAGRPANIVAEEIAAGYRWRDEVLRPAEVKITRIESTNP
jgi:molecular chaperone GrpE (heat shock protein)